MKRWILVFLLCSTVYAQLAISNGTRTVTTSGTAVRIAASQTLASWATIQALSSNTGKVCFGSSTVLASSNNGTCLTPGLAAPLNAVGGNSYDLNVIWVDASVSGEGISYTYVR